MSQLIKKTTSLSPITLNQIPAQIIEEDDGIYITKTDEHNRVHKSLIEKDKALYYNAQMQTSKHDGYFFNIVYASAKCNLNCSMCYDRGSPNREITTAMLKKQLAKSKNHVFVLAGKEPTCRKNLPRLISMISKENYPCLATNGVKLADMNYLKVLKRAGLKHILFSLNALDEKVSCKIHNQEVLKNKLKALENIHKLQIPSIMSTTIIRGINENQIKKIFGYCIEHPIFYELRIRSMAPIGRHPNVKQYCLSELMKMTCNQLNINYRNLKLEFGLMERVNKLTRNKPMMRKTCSSYFHVKVNHKSYTSLGDLLAVQSKMYSLGTIAALGLPLLHFYFVNRKRKSKPLSLPGWIRLSFRSWPNINNIDLDMIRRKCTTRYCDANHGFCETNILES